MPNHLAAERSPYLLQHADNPVDWHPWGQEAFERARALDRPIFLSIGYSTCHWCHVMAHESFENEVVGRLVNENVVAVKVDREEHPDVDAVYMAATQAMTGQGGWPMTVFATPDGKPFFCGTYFPRPQFTHLVQSVAQAWRDQRDAVLRQGAGVVEAVAGMQMSGGPTAPLSESTLDTAAANLAAGYDQVNGGFGGAPKFPPHLAMLFLLRHHQRTGDATSLEIVRHTGEQMARGGIYDQLAGGFARYSVDGQWIVPHFEKMLYDNALLLRVYTELYRLTGDPLARRVAGEIVGFLRSEEDGLSVGDGLASALDADTDGVEGSTYVWTPAQLREVLGDEDGAWAADLLGVTGNGTFEHGTSVLRLGGDVDDPGSPAGERWRAIRPRLLAVRRRRPQPDRDDKVVAAWNGLAVTALCEYARVTREQVAADLATRVGEHLAGTHLVDGRLRRVSRAGRVGEPPGVLEDYGCVAEAFCVLHQVTGEGRWLELAGRLLDTALELFARGDGGFYDTAADAERLFARPSDPTDNATPSGQSSMAAALTSYSALSGESRYREAAERAVATVAPLAARHARFVGYACAVGEALLSGPYEIAIVGGDPTGLETRAVATAPPGAVLVSGEPDQPGVPLLAGRPLVDGQPTAYVCRAFVCDRPVTSVDELDALLAGTR